MRRGPGGAGHGVQIESLDRALLPWDQAGGSVWKKRTRCGYFKITQVMAATQSESFQESYGPYGEEGIPCASTSVLSGCESKVNSPPASLTFAGLPGVNLTGHPGKTSSSNVRNSLRIGSSLRSISSIVPKKRASPWCRKTTRSASLRAKRISWVTTRLVR